MESKPTTTSTNKVKPADKPSVAYKDGVYTGTGEGFGGDITVQVTIKKGRIASVKILSAEDETPAYLKRASALLSMITTAQSTNVDVISGATYSSNGILDATNAALAKAVDKGSSGTNKTPEKPSVVEQPNNPSTEPNGPQEEITYTDGSYTATAMCTDDDLFSYQVQVAITVTDGKITDVGVEKLEDTSDEPEMNETYLNYAINGRTRKNVWYEGVVNQILTKQSADSIDVVSSATYSSEAITAAAKDALQGAKAGETVDPEPDTEEPGVEDPNEGNTGEEPGGEENPSEETPEDPIDDEPDDVQDGPASADGTYTAVALCTDEDMFCYQVQIQIAVTDGVINNIAVEKIEDTSEEPDLNDTYLDYAINGRTRKSVWYEGVVNQIFTKQSADEIDVVSGATYSSNAITTAAQEALQYAKVEAGT